MKILKQIHFCKKFLMCSWKDHEHAHEALMRMCAWSCHAHDHFIELCHPEQKITHDYFKIIEDYFKDASRLIQDYFKTTLISLT